MSLTGSFQRAYTLHSYAEGVEIAVHTSASSVCLDPYELESACMPSGSLAGQLVMQNAALPREQNNIYWQVATALIDPAFSGDAAQSVFLTARC